MRISAKAQAIIQKLAPQRHREHGEKIKLFVKAKN
jgi:hypothetical protein